MEEPQPYLDPQYLPPLMEPNTGQQSGSSLSTGEARFNSKSIPRNFKTLGNVSDFAHANGGPRSPSGSQWQNHHPHSQRQLQRNGHTYTRNSTVAHDMRSPPPTLAPRSSTEVDLENPYNLLGEDDDDPYEVMLSSPIKPSPVRDRDIGNSPTSLKPKPKPRQRKQESLGACPKPKLTAPPARQPTISNEYVELCGDSGATIESDGTSVGLSIDQLSQVMERDVKTNEADVSEKLAQSFTPSQLQLLINMLQKVQTVQSPQGSGGGGTAGDMGAQNIEASSAHLSPSSPRPPCVTDDPATLKGNFSK